MSKPSKPCTEDVNYSFTQCVRDSVTKIIGCRMDFEKMRKLGEALEETGEGENLCTNLEELYKYEEIYRQIYKKNKGTILNITACQFPCSYREYGLVTSQLKSKGMGSSLVIRFAQDRIIVETEYYIYDWISFIAECGGALGLFLGFSFVSLLDLPIISQKLFSNILSGN